MPGHGGNRTYDLWNTSLFRNITRTVNALPNALPTELRGQDGSSDSSEQTSIPKVVGSIPTVAGHIFQARPVWIYTQSNITNISYSPEYTTPAQKKKASIIIKGEWLHKNGQITISHTICSSKNGSTDHRAKSFYCVKLYAQVLKCILKWHCHQNFYFRKCS